MQTHVLIYTVPSPPLCRFITMFALHGRAFAKWPMLIYTVYVVVIVCFMQVGRGKCGVGKS